MALDITKLHRIGPQNSNAPSMFSYGSGADAITTVDGAGYFNGAASKLQIGDLIYVKPDSGTPGLLWVNANSRDLLASPPVEGVVDTSNTLALSSIDSD
jgi:hypothetical protein